MIRKTYLRLGDWNAICDVCGQKYKASELMKRWDGLMVCKEDWEVRHPQELIRPIKERNSVPWTRPRPDDLQVYTCSISGINGVAGIGTAGCAITASDNGQRTLTYPSTFNLSTL